jgi:type IV pilus assembly protein PilB
MSVLDILVRNEKLSKKDAASVSEEMRLSGATLEQALVKHDVAVKDVLEAKGEYLNIPFRSIKGVGIPFEVLKYIPEESAAHYRFVPIAVTQNVLEVGVVDPDNIEARDALNFIASKIGLPFKIFLISEEDFSAAFELYKGLSGEVTRALDELETDIADIDADDGEKPQASEAGRTHIIEDAPVTKIVATILRYAVEGNASDIHIERPLWTSCACASASTATCTRHFILPIKVHDAVIARIKILSNMKLDEKRKPQDGRFSARIEGRKIDFRVSTFPAYYGEKVVMRILDQEKGVKSLEDIGFSPRNLEAIRRAMARPYGLILISGPTGSGKSTTLYSMLNEINDESKNVLSLEDPVEYNMEGVSQSQVRPEIGYTFASGLRTTLRQDPDIIMVGEIRDKETAQLAIQAALTGHLVLSTIHTNNVIGVVPRLIDMGVDPYLIAPTLILSMAQRLVSRICEGGEQVPVEGSIGDMLKKQFADLPEQFRKEIVFPQFVLEPKASGTCPTGVRGRMAIAEVLERDKELERAILANAGEQEMYKLARSKGFISMREDAMLKAFRGEIAFSEVNRL